MLGGWGQENRFRGPRSFGWVWELEYTGADVVSGRPLLLGLGFEGKSGVEVF